MTEVVERVARAIARYNHPGGSDADIDEMWDAWTGEATAAISAMIDAELPPHVVKAGGALSMVKGHQVLANLNAMAIYRAMLAAAVREVGDGNTR